MVLFPAIGLRPKILLEHTVSRKYAAHAPFRTWLWLAQAGQRLSAASFQGRVPGADILVSELQYPVEMVGIQSHQLQSQNGIVDATKYGNTPVVQNGAELFRPGGG